MKKVILSLAIVAMGFSFTSCKKCGRCVYPDGDVSSEVCSSGGAFGKVVYDAAKSDCKSDGGKWKK